MKKDFLDRMFGSRAGELPMVFLIEVLGAVALMLWGLRMVRNGVMSAYGPAIKRYARESSDKRFSPFVSGAIAALALQSSTATAMIASGFAAKRTIGVLTAFLIILGADVGTSIAAVIASQKISTTAPFLLAVGIFGFLNSDETKARGIFRAIGGIGLVLLALSLISGTAAALTSNPQGMVVISTILSVPVLALIAGLCLTYLAHSSLAIVLLAVSGVTGDIFEMTHAVNLVIGANIGSGLLPFLANWKSRKEARVATLANLGLRSAVALVIFYSWPLIGLDDLSLPIDVPLVVHLAVNLIAALIGLLMARPILQISMRVTKDDAPDDQEVHPKYLDNKEITAPSRALALAKREALVMAEIAQEMVEEARALIEGEPGTWNKDIAKLDDGLDRLFDAIKLYVARVLGQNLSDDETRRAMDILSFTANMEHVGDIVDANLTSIATRKQKLHTQFSEEGRAEISALFDSVIENFQLAVDTFFSEDRDMARQLYKAKSGIRELEQQFIASHMERLGSGVSETVRTSSLHIDVIRDLKRINSHLTAVAYPVLLASGEVPKTKWKKAARAG